MASELRKSILESDDIEEETIEVPQWDNAKILVRGMSGKARAGFLKRTSKGNVVDLERFYPELIIATTFDPETPDEPLFEAADRDAISAKSGAALEAVSSVALRLSGMGAGSVDAEVEDLGETPNDGST